jgi:DNA polymerase bacteriophage-type
VAYEFLFLDFETYSLEDLEEVGLDNYARHESTGISMLGWALDHEPVDMWFPHVARPCKKLLGALRNPNIIKVAWSAGFEWNIINKVMGPKHVEGGLSVPITEFRDPIVLAHNISLPGRLEVAGKILKMKEQKKIIEIDDEGTQLKMMFCQPVHKGGEQTLFGISPPLFRDHASHPREFAEYVEYCRQDVIAERDLWYRLIKIPFPQTDWDGWLLDQKINEFGMPGRRDLATKGLKLAERFIAEQRKKLKDLTGLENPNSDTQMKAWVTERGYPWNSMRANYVQQELDNPNSPITAECREALVIRSTARKSSYKKLERFLAVMSKDDRLRNQFKYMAAARTGRWAGGDVQVQNLPRGTKAVKKKLMHALELLEREDYDAIVNEFTNTEKKKDSVTVVEFIITLLRSLFQAKPGKKVIVADLNAIENRVLGWVAGCKAILDVFRTCNDCGLVDEDTAGNFLCPKCNCHKSRCPYISFGTKMYNKDYKEMWASYAAGNEDERQNSKPAVLGAGYGLGGGEMYKNENGDMVRGGLWGYAKSVCGVDMEKDLAHKSVKIFRDSYPEVVQLWTDLEQAFKQVLKRGGVIKVGEVTWNAKQNKWVKHEKCLGCVLTFRRIRIEGGGYMIRMELPSGRALHYLNATIEIEDKVSTRTGKTYTSETIFYDGIEHSATTDATGQQNKKKHKWGRVKTYGGKICENAVQAIARDLLLHGMLMADDMGFHLWGLFHDELATEEDISDMSGLTLSDLIWCMSDVPFWAPGLILGAEGFEGQVYRKG